MSHEGIEATTSPTPDRRDILMEQLTAAEDAAKAAPAAPVPPPPPVTQEETKDRVAPQFGKPAAKPRDETGKWIAKDKAPPATGQPADAAPAAAPALEPWQAAPPTSWKPHLREGWSKLDPAYQRYVHDREQEMRAGVEPLIPKAELADRISQAAAPYMDTIRGLNLDLPRAVGALMKADHDLRTLPFDQKLTMLHQIAMGYGVDLSGQMQTAQATTSPQFQQIQNELMQVRSQMAQEAERREQEAKAREAAEKEAALDQIQSFSATAEFFEEVRPTMAALLQGRLAVDIKDAYEKAIRLDPNLFDKIQSGKQAATDAEKRAAANDAAKRAKAAAVSVKSATPGHPTPANAQDRRSVIRESLEALSERL